MKLLQRYNWRKKVLAMSLDKQVIDNKSYRLVKYTTHDNSDIQFSITQRTDCERIKFMKYSFKVNFTDDKNAMHTYEVSGLPAIVLFHKIERRNNILDYTPTYRTVSDNPCVITYTVDEPKQKCVTVTHNVENNSYHLAINNSEIKKPDFAKQVFNMYAEKYIHRYL